MNEPVIVKINFPSGQQSLLICSQNENHFHCQVDSWMWHWHAIVMVMRFCNNSMITSEKMSFIYLPSGIQNICLFRPEFHVKVPIILAY